MEGFVCTAVDENSATFSMPHRPGGDVTLRFADGDTNRPTLGATYAFDFFVVARAAAENDAYLAQLANDVEHAAAAEAPTGVTADQGVAVAEAQGAADPAPTA